MIFIHNVIKGLRLQVIFMQGAGGGIWEIKNVTRYQILDKWSEYRLSSSSSWLGLPINMDTCK